MKDYNTNELEATIDDGIIWITCKLTDETASLEACESGDLGIDPAILGEIYDFYYESGE